MTGRPTSSERAGMHADTEHHVRGQAIDTEPAVGVTSYLLAGPLCFGGIGYGLDRWFGTSGIVAVGILIGVALSIYVVWLRYGGGAPASDVRSKDRPGDENAGAARPVGPATIATNEESQ